MFQKEIPWTLLGITVVILCAPSAMAAPMTFMRADCPANQLCEFKNDTDPDASKRWDTLWKAMLLPAVQFTGITFVKDPNEPTDLGELFFTKTITFTNLQPVTITFDGPAVGEMFFNISEIATNNTDQDWWDFHFEILDRVEGALQPPFNTLHPSKAHLHPNQFAAANINKLKGLDVPGKNGNNGVPKMSAFANDANDVVPKKEG
jgi:hypothetical protein